MGLMALALGLAENKDNIFDWLEDLVPDPPAKREFGLWPHQILQRNLDYKRFMDTSSSISWEEQSEKIRKEEPFSGLWDGSFSWQKMVCFFVGLERKYLQAIRDIEDRSSEYRRVWVLDGVEGLIERVKISSR